MGLEIENAYLSSATAVAAQAEEVWRREQPEHRGVQEATVGSRAAQGGHPVPLAWRFLKIHVNFPLVLHTISLELPTDVPTPPWLNGSYHPRSAAVRQTIEQEIASKVLQVQPLAMVKGVQGGQRRRRYCHKASSGCFT
jgi:hypothetical protein